MDDDIVSTLGEIPRKFIRELHRVTTYVKIMKVAAQKTVEKIEALYGPFSEKEIEHYRRKLTRDGAPIINSFQKQLINYMYDKEFGDPITLTAIHNQTDYIKLIIAAKRILLKSGMTILPYIISSRIIRIASRKIISKRDMISIELDPLYEQIKQKYNNPKIVQKIHEFIGAVISSSFEMIDWDEENECPTEYDGKIVPIINDMVKQELMYFIESI